MLPLSVRAQYAWQDGAEAGKLDLGKDVRYQVEMQGSFSHGKTPLWLNANKYGLSSLSSTNGYLRGSLVRPLSLDSARRWGIGYGADVAVPLHYTSHVVVQQAFVEEQRQSDIGYHRPSCATGPVGIARILDYSCLWTLVTAEGTCGLWHDDRRQLAERLHPLSHQVCRACTLSQ